MSNDRNARSNYIKIVNSLFDNMIFKECEVGIKVSKMLAVMGKLDKVQANLDDGVAMVKTFTDLQNSLKEIRRQINEQLGDIQISQEDWDRIDQAYRETVEGNKEIQSSILPESEVDKKEPKRKRTPKRNKE